MADYSYNEIIKMQNDAIKRVNEMQKKAKKIVATEQEVPSIKNGNPETNTRDTNNIKRIKMPTDYLDELKSFASTSSYFNDTPNNNTIENEAPQITQNAQKINTNKNSFDSTIKSLLGDFNLDSDKALILSLILLLAEEKADEMLILSLLYILG